MNNRYIALNTLIAGVLLLSTITARANGSCEELVINDTYQQHCSPATVTVTAEENNCVYKLTTKCNDSEQSTEVIKSKLQAKEVTCTGFDGRFECI